MCSSRARYGVIALSAIDFTYYFIMLCIPNYYRLVIMQTDFVSITVGFITAVGLRIFFFFFLSVTSFVSHYEYTV